MRLSKGKNAECVQRLCEIYFLVKWAFLIWKQVVGPCQVITSFLLSSLFVRVG